MNYADYPQERTHAQVCLCLSHTHTFKTFQMNLKTVQGKNGAIWIKEILCHWSLKFEDKLILALVATNVPSYSNKHDLQILLTAGAGHLP